MSIDEQVPHLVADGVRFAAQYKDSRKPLPEIARELGVDAVIEGSVLRSGDHVRVTAQLIRAGTETRVWGDTYERDIRDVLALQDEVAKAITDEINIRLAPEEERTSKPHRAVNPAAYEDYLKGQFSLGASVDGTQKSIAFFEKSIREDRNYALAYVGLADSYVWLGHVVHLPPTEAFPKAKAAVLKALQLDDTLGEAHGTLADVKFLYDWEPGEKFSPFCQAMIASASSFVVTLSRLMPARKNSDT